MAARAAEALAKAALDAGDALASSAEAYAKTASDKRLEAERNVDDAPRAALQARAAADACAKVVPKILCGGQPLQRAQDALQRAERDASAAEKAAEEALTAGALAEVK